MVGFGGSSTGKTTGAMPETAGNSGVGAFVSDAAIIGTGSGSCGGSAIGTGGSVTGVGGSGRFDMETGAGTCSTEAGTRGGGATGMGGGSGGK